MPHWEKRRVGRTRLEVTSLGLGTATMGGSRIQVTRQDGEDLVRAAWNAGVRYVDTAPFYGVGSAERRVGDALRHEDRSEWVLSTKVGRLLRPGVKPGASDGRMSPMPFHVLYDYSHDGIMRSVEDSHQRLGLDRIDILYVHDIGEYQHGQEANAHHLKVLRDSGYKALDRLRHSGEVQAIGIGVNEKQVLIDALSFGDWDVFLLAGRYTLLEQGPLDDLLPMCSARGTSIVVGGPLNSGILAGRDTWNYAAAPPEIVARVDRIRAVCEAHKVPLAAAALQFPLAHPAVCAIIPGPRSAAEFDANLPLLTMEIPAALWADLRQAELLHPEAPAPSYGRGPRTGTARIGMAGPPRGGPVAGRNRRAEAGAQPVRADRRRMRRTGAVVAAGGLAVALRSAAKLRGIAAGVIGSDGGGRGWRVTGLGGAERQVQPGVRHPAWGLPRRVARLRYHLPGLRISQPLAPRQARSLPRSPALPVGPRLARQRAERNRAPGRCDPTFWRTTPGRPCPVPPAFRRHNAGRSPPGRCAAARDRIAQPAY